MVDPKDWTNQTLSEAFSTTTAYVDISGASISFTKDYKTPQALHPISGHPIVRAVSGTSKSLSSFFFFFFWLRQYKLIVNPPLRRVLCSNLFRYNMSEPFQYEWKLYLYQSPVSPSWSLYGPLQLSCTFRFDLSSPKVEQVHALKNQRRYCARSLSCPPSFSYQQLV